MFLKQRQTHSWSCYLPGKKYIYPKGKIVKSLHHYVLSQWKRFWVYIYALCIGLRSKYFTLTGGLKSGKCECLWSSAEHTAEAVTCQGKIYLSHSKNRQIFTSLCSKSVKTFLIMHLCTLQQHAFTNALHEWVIWNLPRTIVCQTASKTQVMQLLARCTDWTTKNIIMHIVPWKTRKVLISHEILFAQKNKAKFYLHVAWAFSNCQLLDAEM